MQTETIKINKGNAKMIAHRGVSAVAKENSLAAFELAGQSTHWGIETDVHLTADGVPVICHNYTIDKTSNGRGAIREMNFDVFKRIYNYCRYNILYF